MEGLIGTGLLLPPGRRLRAQAHRAFEPDPVKSGIVGVYSRERIVAAISAL